VVTLTTERAAIGLIPVAALPLFPGEESRSSALSRPNVALFDGGGRAWDAPGISPAADQPTIHPPALLYHPRPAGVHRQCFGRQKRCPTDDIAPHPCITRASGLCQRRRRGTCPHLSDLLTCATRVTTNAGSAASDHAAFSATLNPGLSRWRRGGSKGRHSRSPCPANFLPHGTHPVPRRQAAWRSDDRGRCGDQCRRSVPVQEAGPHKDGPSGLLPEGVSKKR